MKSFEKVVKLRMYFWSKTELDVVPINLLYKKQGEGFSLYDSSVMVHFNRENNNYLLSLYLNPVAVEILIRLFTQILMSRSWELSCRDGKSGGGEVKFANKIFRRLRQNVWQKSIEKIKWGKIKGMYLGRSC